MSTPKVFKFYKISFDENWKLLSTTNQLFTYINRRPASVQVCYEGPQGSVFTALLSCRVETKAIIHRDVLHINASAKYAKGDIIKPD